MKRILLSVIAFTVLAGAFSPAEAQHRRYYRHHYRHCFYRHHHRVCR